MIAKLFDRLSPPQFALPFRSQAKPNPFSSVLVTVAKLPGHESRRSANVSDLRSLHRHMGRSATLRVGKAAKLHSLPLKCRHPLAHAYRRASASIP